MGIAIDISWALLVLLLRANETEGAVEPLCQCPDYS